MLQPREELTASRGLLHTWAGLCCQDCHCCVTSSWASKVAHPVLSLFHNYPLSLQHHSGKELIVFLPQTHSLGERRKAK